MRERVRVKICGVTSVEDAVACVAAGADAIGLNFWPESPRRCTSQVAKRIMEEIGDEARVVAVLVDQPREASRLRRDVGLRWLQLHGDETPSELSRWLPEAYKAVRPATELDVDAALRFGGDEILVDARVRGLPGGTGVRAEWSLAERIARNRRVWLAGGLTPDNVRNAIEAVRPYGVDVASGVESAPGKKDLERVRELIQQARTASL